MKKTNQCPFEEQLLSQLAAGELSPELETHSQTCPVCGDARLVAGFMTRFQAVSREKSHDPVSLPDAETLWDHAFDHPLPQKKLIEKAMRPIKIAQRFTIFAIAAGVLLVLGLNLPGIQQYFGSHVQDSLTLAYISRFFKSMTKGLSFALLPPFALSVLAMLIVWLTTVIKQPETSH